MVASARRARDWKKTASGWAHFGQGKDRVRGRVGSWARSAMICVCSLMIRVIVISIKVCTPGRARRGGERRRGCRRPLDGRSYGTRRAACVPVALPLGTACSCLRRVSGKYFLWSAYSPGRILPCSSRNCFALTIYYIHLYNVNYIQ